MQNITNIGQLSLGTIKDIKSNLINSAKLDFSDEQNSQFISLIF